MAGSSVVLVLLVLMASFIFPSIVLGTEYVVGDDEGWGAGLVDYSAWASSHTFSVGDSLVFRYQDTTEYDVVVAAGPDAFEACAASPNLGFYDSGNDVLTFTAAGNYYFFSDGHCEYNDMKFMVSVS